VQETIQSILIWAPPVLAAVILHEIAHGYVALHLGDPTAAERGRLTLNPLRHIDPVGTVLLPLVLILTHAGFVFGWARPVPIDFRRLRNPKADMVKVAAAGPLTNLVLAALSAAVYRVLAGLTFSPDGAFTGLAIAVLTPVALMARASVLINVGLAIFNMIPIPPLDGGRVLTGLLPRPQAIAFARLERYGLLILMALLFTRALDRIVGPVFNVVLQVLL
jgi:Zn-dependent protease